MNKIKRYFANRLLKFVSSTRLRDELLKRGFNDAYRQLAETVVETWYKESAQIQSGDTDNE